jgi:hypothetical protein
MELRAAAAACAQAAQQAVDLIMAQIRAAYLTRGLPAPALEARIPVPDAPPSPADPAAMSAFLEATAEAMRANLGAQAEKVCAALRGELRTFGTPAASREATSAIAEARERLQGLRALEDDIARLDALLEPLLV